MRWWTLWPEPDREEDTWFILGDDTPAETDCLLPVAQGITSFSTGYSPSLPPKYGSTIHTWPGGSRTCMPK